MGKKAFGKVAGKILGKGLMKKLMLLNPKLLATYAVFKVGKAIFKGVKNFFKKKKAKAAAALTKTKAMGLSVISKAKNVVSRS